MSNRKKKKRRALRAGRIRSKGPAFVRMTSPFAGIAHADVVDGFLKAGEAYGKQYEDSLAKLQTILCSVDLLHVLSALAASGLFVGVTESGQMQRKDEASSIGQHHVELLQALALQIPQEQQFAFPASPDKIQEILDLLLSLATAFDNKRYRQVAEAQSEQEKAVMLVQEHLRLHTHCVRNWGYFRNVVAILRDLYAPLDAYFEQEAGLSATSLIDTFQYLVRDTETRMNEYRGRLRPAFLARTVQEAIAEYCKAFPQLKDKAGDLSEDFESHRVPPLCQNT